MKATDFVWRRDSCRQHDEVGDADNNREMHRGSVVVYSERTWYEVMFHLDISQGGMESPAPRYDNPPRRRLKDFFFTLVIDCGLQAYERNLTVRCDFCLQISVVL